MHDGEGLTPTEIAEFTGGTGSRVGQIHTKALRPKLADRSERVHTAP
jgi:hypothetical protein